jgi:PIN domain nuclease of toxin-antitoxin system
VVPASAYSEMLVHPYRMSQRTAREAERFVHELPARVVPVDGDIAWRAAEIRARRTGVTLGDALVLASGDILDAAEVLTADASWSKLSRRVQAI